MSENEIIETEESEKKKASRKEQDLLFLGKSASELLNSPENSEFKSKLFDVLRNIKENKPFLDPKKVYDEIDFLNVNINLSLESDEELEIYCHILDNIQKALDRLAYLYNKAEREYNLLEHYYNYLTKIWTGKFSRLSSDKRREGEAEFILDFIIHERIKRLNLFNTVKGVMKNFLIKKDTVSRKITIIQEVHRIIGIYTSESPKDFKTNLDKHRKNILVKAEEYKKNNPDQTGWGAVPSLSQLGLDNQTFDDEIEL